MSEHSELAGDPALAVWLGRLQEGSFNRAGPAVRNAYPPERRMTGPLRLDNVRANTWLALSIIEGEHDTHAAMLTEGPAEVLPAIPQDVRHTTELRNAGAGLDWATAWLRVTPRRLFSFAEHAWQDASGSSSAH